MAGKPKLQFDFEGVKSFDAAMRDLKQSARNKVNRAAVTAGARVGVKSVKAVAPRRFGYLAKAQAFKIQTFDNGYTLAIMGTDKGKAYDGPEGREVPANYDHLVHDGHINSDGGFTPGSPYLELGILVAQDDQGAAMEGAAGKALQRAMDKAAVKGRRRR